MKMKALAVLAALCMPTAHSEELTKPELGRLDVSKCYITCSDQISRMVPAFYNTALLSEPNFELVHRRPDDDEHRGYLPSRLPRPRGRVRADRFMGQNAVSTSLRRHQSRVGRIRAMDKLRELSAP